MMTENEKQLVEGHLYLIRNIILNTISMNKNTEELEYLSLIHISEPTSPY